MSIKVKLLSVFLILGISSFAYAIDQGSVVGIWLFDEGEGEVLKDSSRNGNNGTVAGAKWVDGKFGKALQFNGSSSYVEVPSSDSLNSIADEITVVAWMKYANWGNWARVVARGNWTAAMDQYQFLLLLGGSTGDMGFCVSIKGERASYAGRTALKQDQWHHVAGTSDGVTVKLYVDGELIGSSASAKPVNKVEEEPLTIGCGYAGARAAFFSGTVDEVAIFNKAISDQDLKELMKGLKAITTAVEPKEKLATTWGDVKN